MPSQPLLVNQRIGLWENRNREHQAFPIDHGAFGGKMFPDSTSHPGFRRFWCHSAIVPNPTKSQRNTMEMWSECLDDISLLLTTHDQLALHIDFYRFVLFHGRTIESSQVLPLPGRYEILQTPNLSMVGFNSKPLRWLSKVILRITTHIQYDLIVILSSIV